MCYIPLVGLVVHQHITFGSMIYKVYFTCYNLPKVISERERQFSLDCDRFTIGLLHPFPEIGDSCSNSLNIDIHTISLRQFANNASIAVPEAHQMMNKVTNCVISTIGRRCRNAISKGTTLLNAMQLLVGLDFAWWYKLTFKRLMLCRLLESDKFYGFRCLIFLLWSNIGFDAMIPNRTAPIDNWCRSVRVNRITTNIQKPLCWVVFTIIFTLRL